MYKIYPGKSVRTFYLKIDFLKLDDKFSVAVKFHSQE